MRDNEHVKLVRYVGAAFLLACFISKPLQYQANAAPADDVGDVQRLIMSDPAQALTEARLVERRLQHSPDRPEASKLIFQIRSLEGAALFRLHRAPEALAVTSDALNQYRPGELRDPQLLGELHMTKGEALAEMTQVEQATRELQEAYLYFKRAGNKRSQAIVLQVIGSVYLLARNYDRGLWYYAQSQDTFPGDASLLVSAFHNRGVARLEQGRFLEARGELQNALRYAQSLHSSLLEARILGYLALAQIGSEDLTAADQTVSHGLELAKATPAGDWVALLYQAGAQLALRRNQLNLAAQMIGRAFSAVNSKDKTVMLRDLHRTAYEVFKARGDYDRSLEHLEAFKELDDKVLAVATSTNTALMAAQFDFANQNVRIAQLRTTETQNEARIARGQRTILTILLAGSGIVTVLLLIGFVSIRRSRNEVRAANDELSATNAELEGALAARTQFLATTSHEIRTPLNGILGMTQVLLADRSVEAGVKERIQLVHGAGETMRALVDDILDVAKMTTGELRLHPAEMDLARLLAETVRVWDGQAQSKGIAITLDATATPARIVADEVRLRQILFNLVANAVKFTDRGEVLIAARAVGARDGDIDGDGGRDAGGGERLVVAIRDTGIGIPPDQLDRIFESFRQVDGGTTRRHGGTGLGLAICRHLARAMGGDVHVASVLGAGATFTLDVPLVRGAEQATVAARPAAHALEGARALLVEGNPLTQSILRAVLGGRVAALAVASDAGEARETIAREAPDLLLIDAATLGRDVAAAGALAAPVAAAGGLAVLLCAAPDDEIRARAEAAGLARVIATPIAAPDLVAALAALYVSERPAEEIAA